MKNLGSLYVTGSILLVVGALTALTGSSWSAYTYMAGALAYALFYLFQPHKGLSVRAKRLVRMNLIGGILFVVSAVFRISQSNGTWILFFALAMVFMIYANFAQMIHEGRSKPKP